MPIESLNKELAFGSDQHQMLVRRCVDRKVFSLSKMVDHHQRWRKADDNIRGFIPKSQADTNRQNRRDTKGKMDYVTLEVPYSFAIISSLHTYISSVFLSRTPVFQFTARHGEGQDSVMAVEATMDYQLHVGTQLPYLYNWLWDTAKYGIGVIGEFWDEETKRIARIVKKEKKFLGVVSTGKFDTVREVYEEVGYQGNRFYNIRPYDFFPDPRIPLYDFQRGEFCGRQVVIGMSELEDGALYGRYFNVDVLKGVKGETDKLPKYSRSVTPADISLPLETGATSSSRPSQDNTAPGKGFMTLLEMVVKISPRAWGLGDRDAPEKWVFSVVNETVLVGARPMGLFHDKFPYSIMETGFGSEDFIKDNTLDHIRPLNETLTWLFNTHMYNVRKAINTVRVVDPSKIVMKDLDRPQPGGNIRLKPSFYGGDVRTAVTQLEAQDVTARNLQDTGVIEQFIQRTSGVVDSIMGVVPEGGRKTATEIRTSSGFSVNRIKTLSEYCSALGFGPLAERTLSNTQQLLSMDAKLAIAGNTMQNAQSFMQVNPAAIMGFFDFVPVDGTLPIDRLAQANFWKELLMQLARVPQLAMQWDIGAMLGHTMMLQGERNIDRFKIQVQPQNPGAIAPPGGGNVVPITGAPNGGIPTGTGGGPRSAYAAGGAGSAQTTM